MSVQEDKDRLEKSILHVFAKVAEKYTNKKENPEYLDIDNIERNGVKRPKTIRLLQENGYLSEAIIKKVEKQYCSSYNTTNYKVLKFKEECEKYASKDHFIYKWEDIYNDELSYSCLADNSFEIAGYLRICKLPDKTQIDLYIHPDDYDFYPIDDPEYIYPKNLLEKRKIAVMRCFVERVFNESFFKNIDKMMGRPFNSGPCTYNEEHISISIRNFLHTPFHFNKESFNGNNGFLKELDYYIQYLNTIKNHVQNIVNHANNNGGFEKVIREYRKWIINDLIENAPLRVFEHNKDDSNTNKSIELIDTEDLEEFLQLGSNYLLKYAMDIFNYDTLYADDERVLYINTNAVDNSPFSYNLPDGTYTHLWLPEENQINYMKTHSNNKEEA